jgi:hypothetical protein
MFCFKTYDKYTKIPCGSSASFARTMRFRGMHNFKGLSHKKVCAIKIARLKATM